MDNAGEIFQVVTANRLRDGVIVYFNETDNTWVERIAEATSYDEHSINDALARAKTFEAACEVVGIYPTEVAGRNRPLSAREQIRAAGPSIKYGHAAVQPDFSI
jgi:hypothetical protein